MGSPKVLLPTLMTLLHIYAGKFFSEGLILASNNQQYDKRLFIELRIQYVKNTSSENCVHKLFWISIPNCTTSSELVVFMYWTRTSINNLLSYCWLPDAEIRASDKYLPVTCEFFNIWNFWNVFKKVAQIEKKWNE